MTVDFPAPFRPASSKDTGSAEIYTDRTPLMFLTLMLSTFIGLLLVFPVALAEFGRRFLDPVQSEPIHPPPHMGGRDAAAEARALEVSTVALRVGGSASGLKWGQAGSSVSIS